MESKKNEDSFPWSQWFAVATITVVIGIALVYTWAANPELLDNAHLSRL